MKTFAFVRSRTYYREFDYRLLTPISALPYEIHNHFSNCITNLLRDGVQEWNTPAWLLIKRDGYLLWGVAVSNRIFSEDCCQEEVGRQRGVRCFCGVVISDYDSLTIQLPYDIRAFQPVFDQTISRLWMERVYEIPDTQINFADTDSYITPSLFDNRLNVNSRICRLFPSETNAQTLLSACLACDSDISIAVNIENSNQICDTKHAQPILNAIMRDSTSQCDIPVKYKCSKCGRMVDEIRDGLCTDCQPKIEPLRNVVLDSRNENSSLETSTSHICKKCHQSVNDVNERGVCPNCERNIKRRRVLIWLYVGIFIVYCVGMCLHKFKKKTINNQINTENMENETSKDTISDSHQILNLLNQFNKNN